ncbi:Os07g0456033 [Oryza sativa Japonica Group]|uniref:Os07g0456033 protein n=1 Tax=Oryza sativa subsp. japonica TaxID=39947 RepID=A0A0P0X5J6_ORYSJ|nr:Os07g0456033 [Oryza sativa Japonica Group]
MVEERVLAELVLPVPRRPRPASRQPLDHRLPEAEAAAVPLLVVLVDAPDVVADEVDDRPVGVSGGQLLHDLDAEDHGDEEEVVEGGEDADGAYVFENLSCVAGRVGEVVEELEEGEEGDEAGDVEHGAGGEQRRVLGVEEVVGERQLELHDAERALLVVAGEEAGDDEVPRLLVPRLRDLEPAEPPLQQLEQREGEARVLERPRTRPPLVADDAVAGAHQQLAVAAPDLVNGDDSAVFWNTCPVVRLLRRRRGAPFLAVDQILVRAHVHGVEVTSGGPAVAAMAAVAVPRVDGVVHVVGDHLGGAHEAVRGARHAHRLDPLPHLDDAVEPADGERDGPLPVDAAGRRIRAGWRCWPG